MHGPTGMRTTLSRSHGLCHLSERLLRVLQRDSAGDLIGSVPEGRDECVDEVGEDGRPIQGVLKVRSPDRRGVRAGGARISFCTCAHEPLTITYLQLGLALDEANDLDRSFPGCLPSRATVDADLLLRREVLKERDG